MREGILGDLFPGVSLPTVDYANMRAAIVENCARNNLQPLESFIIKVIERLLNWCPGEVCIWCLVVCQVVAVLSK
jgi:hypothetical protein